MIACVLSCPTFCDLIYCSPWGSSVCGISQGRYWSGLPFPPPGNLSHPEIEPASPESPALVGRFFTTEPPGKPLTWLQGQFLDLYILWKHKTSSRPWKRQRQVRVLQVQTSDFPGGPVVKNPPTNARDVGSFPGPGRVHMPRGNQCHGPQLLSPRALCSAGAHALQQEKPPWGEARAPN